MLRPTDSKIVFLQQLGRGLRKSLETGKKRLVILDFIGNHISFFRKVDSLLRVGVTNSARKKFLSNARKGNLSLPKNCFVNIELNAIDILQKLVSNNINKQTDIYIGSPTTSQHSSVQSGLLSNFAVGKTITTHTGLVIGTVSSMSELPFGTTTINGFSMREYRVSVTIDLKQLFVTAYHENNQILGLANVCEKPASLPSVELWQ